MKDGKEINELVETTCEKDLVVYIDPELCFTEHLSTITHKAKNMCYLLLRVIIKLLTSCYHFTKL